MNKYALALLVLLSFAHAATAQSVGVGTNTPNSSAILDISSTSKGVLLPRMTTAQRDAIVNPASGLIIFNTDDQCTDVYNGSSWIKNCGFKQTGSVTIPADTWLIKKALPGLARTFATSFVINNKAYIGTGNAGSSYLNDLWEFNPSSNSWNQKADLPGPARVAAASFAIGTKGYIGTGASDVHLNDFWEYDAIQNSWTQKANFAGVPRVGAAGFAVGGKGYFTCGRGSSSSTINKELWEYDPALDSWVQKASLPASIRVYPSAFTIAGKAYVGFGTTTFGINPSNFNDLWEYDPSTDIWIGKGFCPGGVRYGAAAFSDLTKGYIGGGFRGTGPTYLNDFWEFDPALSSWTQKANYPYGVGGAVGFSIGNNGFLGFGEVSYGNYDNRLWEYNFTSKQTPEFTPNINMSAMQFYDGIWEKNINEIASPGRTIVSTPLTTTIQGNVGIGISTTNAPLQFANTTVNRKIVLYDANNDDNQFNGFGINIDAIRYQTASIAADHAFFAGTSATTSNELFRIKGNGNVGIGTSTPNAPLQFANTAVNRKIVFYDANNNDHQFSGLGLNNDAVRYQVAGTNADHAFYAGTSSTTSNELFRIKGNGNVGIGVSSPNAQLQFTNTPINRKIVLYEVANNDHQYFGFGINTEIIRYQVGNLVSDHVFFAGTSATTSVEIMRIKGTGRVGIGTSTPSQALHVVGNIFATGTITPSDARYKKNILLIDHPLEKLQQLNGVTYNYRSDEFPDMKFPDATQVGLIAQEVEKVFPQLVFTDDKGYKAVDYVKLIPLLIESVKEQNKKLEQLDSLKAEVEALKKLLINK